MSSGQKAQNNLSKSALPVDAREALQWFVNNFGLYIGSTRGLFISDWTEERESTLEAAIINLKSRGFTPLAVTGETLYKQADYLWKESRNNSQFGRPLASKLELELSGSDIVIVDNLEAPENSRHLWYLYSHLLFPRALAGKATIITTPLSFAEFMRYGGECQDPDFCGKPLNWEKLVWLIEASMISLDMFKQARSENLPPMLQAEYDFYLAMKERGLDVVAQHVLGDFMLDFAIVSKDHKLNIECDTISALSGSEVQRQEAKRNLVLFSDDWQVLKFSTADIIGNKAACVEACDEVWRTGRKRGAAGRLSTGNTVAPMPDLPVDDDVQLAAITYGGGPAAVAGGAGTGKTTCIVQRVAYLIGQGVSAESILVLTFNQDTQKSLKRLLEQVVDKQTVQRMGVFSWQDLGLKILKENLPAIKRKPPLKIEPNQQKVIQRLLAKVKKDIDPAKLELSVDLDEFYIAAVISMYKAHLISHKQAKAEAGTYGEEIIAKIYQQLEEQLQKANRIDRDDVIAMAVQVLLDNVEARSRYQQQYEFLLIDEFQDATVAQDMLARILAAPQDNLFFVGDEDETIAESKNACPEMFTEMSLRLPFARCFMLERNWRSHPAIVDHARQLIAGLKRRRITKEFVSAWGQAPASAIVGPAALNDEHEEAAWVANEIQLLVDSGRSYADIAIIYRHHVYATILEDALNAKNVRYQCANPIMNMVPDEVEDMLSFLKLVVDPDGPRARESFERVCQLRAGEIDPKLSATIASFAEANNLSYLKAIEIYSEATADQSCRELEQLVRSIRTLHQDRLPPAEAIALLRRTRRLNEYYRSVKVPPGVNYEPLKKLTEFEDESRNFKTIADFIKHVTAQRQSGTGLADPGVQVLPILDCKGQEFPIVFMVGMAEGIFPADTTIDLEEERRICYLGFTRAKELLYISYPVLFSGAMLQPSHFLVDARLLAAPSPMQAHDHYQHELAVLQQLDPASPQFHEQQLQVAAAAQYQQQVEYQQQQAELAAAAQYQQQQAELAAAAQYQQQQAELAAAALYQQQQAELAAAAQYQQQQAELAAAAQYQQQQAELAAAAQYQQQQAELVAAAAYPIGAEPVVPVIVPHPNSLAAKQEEEAEVEVGPTRTVPPLGFALAAEAAILAQQKYDDSFDSQLAFQVYTGENQIKRNPGLPALPVSKAMAADAPINTADSRGDSALTITPPKSRSKSAVGNESVASGSNSLPPNFSWNDADDQTAGQYDQHLSDQSVPAVVPIQQPHFMAASFAQAPQMALPQERPEPVQPEPHTHVWTPAPQDAGQTASQHAEAGHPLCPSCQDPLEANSRFCGGCGYTLPERVPACPTCGAPLESSAKFCGECGMSLVAPAAGNSATVTSNMARMHELKDKQQGWTNKIWKMLES